MSGQAPSAAAPIDTPVTPFEQRVGHHPALFVLFFAEMWERFSYYGMRALLVFYMTRGFLHYDDTRSYGVYGAYTALVYMTPFVGGLVADRLLGPRTAVIIGGSLMALGHLLMTIEHPYAFFCALALLICGNGFFKPNIGTILGSLYVPDRLNPKRDGAFTIFYMGVNLGAAMAPLLCGYIGETYGWHYGFGLATIGMLVGLAVFIAPTLVTQVLIGAGAFSAALALIFAGSAQTRWILAVNAFVAASVLVAMVFALWALAHGALPKQVGSPRNWDRYPAKLGAVLGAIAVMVPTFAWLCSHPQIAGYVLYVVGAVALVYVLVEAFRVTPIERERIFVILILGVFSMLFWAFFEQAGSSMNNFTDRNVDRVAEERRITHADVGRQLEIELTQEQLGWPHEGDPFTLDELSAARQAAQARGETTARATWLITEEHIGMGIGGQEIPASVFQATNPIFILLFGLVFTALWGFLGRRNLEPSTPTKFVLGLLQLGTGFGVLWLGAQNADSRGMVAMGWLVLAYLLHTTGELCLSPVGLSMVSKMAPARMVATMMGAWYLATAFSQYLAGLIATFTGVGHSEEGTGMQVIPPPRETLHVYGDVFLKIALASFVAASILAVLTPLVKKWMHEEQAPRPSP